MDIVVSDPSLGIAAAINQAQPGDVIKILAATYNGTQNCDLTVSKNNLTLMGIPSPLHGDTPVIDCARQSRCLSVANAVELSISNIRFVNGKANSYIFTSAGPTTSTTASSFVPPSNNLRAKMDTFLTPFNKVLSNSNDEDGFGGCIFVTHSSNITLSNVKVSGCSAYRGGGLAVFKSHSVLVSFCDFSLNSANTSDNAFGAGAMFNSTSAVIVRDSQFSRNSLTVTQNGNAFGAGLLVTLSQVVIGPNVTFNDNFISTQNGTGQGSGLHLFDTDKSNLTGPIFIVNNSMHSVFSFITASGMIAAGCSNLNVHGPISIVGNSLYADYNSTFGAAMCIYSCANVTVRGPITITDSFMQANMAPFQSGAGLFSFNSQNVTLEGPWIVSNCTIENNFGPIYGGGIYFYDCDGLVLRGPMTLANIFMSSNIANDIAGAALGIVSTNHTAMYGPIHAINNTIVGYASALFGGGVFMLACIDFVAMGPIVAANNRIIGVFRQLQVTEPYVSNQTCQHVATSLISQSSGTISDGYYPHHYPKGVDCSWTIAATLSTFDRSFGLYQISVARFDIFNSFACTVDFLSLYDGPSSNYPLIGTYCGQLQNVFCNRGRCPSLLHPINTTGAAIFVQFHTDNRNRIQYPYGSGFEVAWELVAAPLRSDGFAGSIPNLSEEPNFGTGGGFHIESSVDVVLSGLVVVNNSVVHPLLAVGGGLSATIASKVKVLDSIIEGNSVNAYTSGGGGVAAFEYAQISLISTNISNNLAAASSASCLYSYDYVIRCPSSNGGAVLALGSTVSSESSIFGSNLASCDPISPQCQANGGAFAATRNASIVFTRESQCENNSINCGTQCSLGSGGCLFADSSLIQVYDSSIERNRVPQGVGGAVVGAASATIEISGSLLGYNLAEEGGAIQLRDFASATILNSELSHNHAASLGGAYSTSGTASIRLSDSILANNSAPVASSGMTIGNFTSIQNVTMIGWASIFTLVIGSQQVASLAFECMNRGSFFQMENRNLNYFSLECKTCSSGTYLSSHGSSANVNTTRECLSCPIGAKCFGSNSSNNGIGLMALREFWGVLDGDEAQFFQCPQGYCCQDDFCDYDSCAGNRKGTLCGSCESGYGMQFFSNFCARNDDCNAAGWVAVMLIVGFGAIVVVMVVFSDFSSDGMFSIVIFFYQAAPLVMSLNPKNLISPITTAVQSVFNLSPHSNGSDGICVKADMTTIEKMGLSIAAYGLFLLMTAVVWGMHVLAMVLKRKNFITLWLEKNPPTPSRYAAIATKIITFSYITVTINVLDMLDCIDIHPIDIHPIDIHPIDIHPTTTTTSAAVWFFDGDVECFQPWQKLAIAMAVVLCLLPFLVGGIVMKWGHGANLDDIQSTIRKVLVSPYRARRWWWAAVSLGRRLLLSIAFTWTSTNGWRSGSMFILSSLFLASQIWAAPYSSVVVENIENVSLIILCILSALSSRRLTFEQFGLYDDKSNGVEAVQLALFLVPGAAVGYQYMKRAIRIVSNKWKRSQFMRTQMKREVELKVGLMEEDLNNNSKQ